MAQMSREFRALRIGYRHPLICAAVGGIALATAAGSALAQDKPVDQRLNVGRTGITCVRLPCPHRGIYMLGARDLPSLRRALLYADLDGRQGLPTIVGSPADQAELRQAWDRQKCVAIAGHLEGPRENPTLHVARVIGPCR